MARAGAIGSALERAPGKGVKAGCGRGAGTY